MKRRFAEILVLIGCTVLFSVGAAGLLADSDDEFDLDPPPGIQNPQSGNDASKQDGEEDELPPAPELETPDEDSDQEPDQKPVQEQKKTRDQIEEEDHRDELKNSPNDPNEEDEDFLLIPEDVSEPETEETSETAETTEKSEKAGESEESEESE